MAKFSDSIKTVLSDMERFLVLSLKEVKMGTSVNKQRLNILNQIKSMREEYNQLEPEPNRKIDYTITEDDKIKDIKTVEADEKAKGKSNGTSKADTPIEETKRDVAAADIEGSSVASGFLKKKDKKSSLFSKLSGKKWYILDSGILYAYDKSTSKKQKETLDLKGYKARAPVSDMAKKELYFEIFAVENQETYALFETQTPEEVAHWIDQINKVSKGTHQDDEQDDLYYEDAPETESDGDLIDEAIYEETDNFAIPPTPPKATFTPARPTNPIPPTPSESEEVYDDTGEGPAEPDGEMEDYYDDVETLMPDRPKLEESISQDGDEFYDDTDNVKPTASSSKPTEDEDDDIYDEGESLENNLTPSAKEGKVFQPVGVPLMPNQSKLHSELSKVLSSRPTPALPPAANKPLPKLPQALPPTPPPKNSETSNSSAGPGHKPAVVPPPEHAEKNPGAVATNNNNNNGFSHDTMFYCQWDCATDRETELAFKRGDIVQVTSKKFDDDGWWVGRIKGKTGLVPKVYLTQAYVEA